MNVTTVCVRAAEVVAVAATTVGVATAQVQAPATGTVSLLPTQQFGENSKRTGVSFRATLGSAGLAGGVRADVDSAKQTLTGVFAAQAGSATIVSGALSATREDLARIRAAGYRGRQTGLQASVGVETQSGVLGTEGLGFTLRGGKAGNVYGARLTTDIATSAFTVDTATATEVWDRATTRQTKTDIEGQGWTFA